jgi:hypothetical protein
VYRLLLARDALAPMDTLRLRFPGNHDYFDMEDVKMWIRHAIKRNACVIQLNGPKSFVGLYRIDFVSRHLKVLKLSFACVYDTNQAALIWLPLFGRIRVHLKVLKLSFACVYDTNFRQLSSGYPCLEELEFKSCLVETSQIISASLKSLIMIKCDFILNVTVDYPNLMVVRCVAPQKRVPLFKNLGSLVTGSVMLDDSLLRACFLKYHDNYEFAQTGDLDSDYTCPGTFSKKKHDEDNYSDSVDTFGDSNEFSDDSGYSSEYSPDDIDDNYDYGSDINSDTDTCEYSEIANGSEDWQFGNCDDGHGSSKGSSYHDCSARYAITENKRSGGQSVLHSLSSAQCLELLGHSGEVYSLT